MNGRLLVRRASKTEQKNRVKTASGDFLIINRKKQEKRNRRREKGERERGSTSPSS
jgi:hypothetical protein